MSKLSDTQLVILATAAARPNQAVLPPPQTLTLNNAALAKVINSLLSRALTAETPARAGDDAIWRDDGDQRLSLSITKAGLDAIGVDVGEQSQQQPEAEEHPVTSQSSPRRGGGKVKAVLELLRRPEGASIGDINAATGWQAHSIRAFLSGLRKKGMEVARTKDEGGKVLYTLAPEFLAEG